MVGWHKVRQKRVSNLMWHLKNQGEKSVALFETCFPFHWIMWTQRGEGKGMGLSSTQLMTEFLPIWTKQPSFISCFHFEGLVSISVSSPGISCFLGAFCPITGSEVGLKLFHSHEKPALGGEFGWLQLAMCATRCCYSRSWTINTYG